MKNGIFKNKKTIVTISIVVIVVAAILGGFLIKQRIDSAKWQEGDVYYFKTDLEDEQTESVTADGDVLVGEDGAEYRYAPEQSDEEWVEIFCDSDDRVDMHFYTGEIQISKDAVHSIPIINEERAITLDALNTGLYFNGACFTDSMLTKLISYGD